MLTALDTFVGEATAQRVTVFYSGSDGDLNQQSGRLTLMDETGVLLIVTGAYVFLPADRVVKIKRDEV